MSKIMGQSSRSRTSESNQALRLPEPLSGEWYVSVDRAGRPPAVLWPERGRRIAGGYMWHVGNLRVSLGARRQPGDPAAWVLRVVVTNNGKRSVRVNWIELTLNGLAAASQLAPLRQAGARVFLDAGWLGGSGVRDLGLGEGRTNVLEPAHESHGVSVLVDADRTLALAAGFLSFRDAHVTLTLPCDEGGAWCGLSARSDFINGRHLEPGRTLRSEALWLRCCAGGHEGLGRWADAVVRYQRLPAPRARPSGWNSWYAYRLVISEDLVLANARVIAERFREYGATNVQIDHGWQDRNIVGNWIPNERFPHGLPWLARRLGEMGLTLGLWTAVSHVSEFAPFYKEHPEALLHDSDATLRSGASLRSTSSPGAPLVADQRWFWEPHGRTFTPDPTHPTGLAFYRNAGRVLRKHGAIYVKNDFQGNLMRHDVSTYDRRASLGPPLYLRAMRAFQQGMGAKMIRHGCNAPLNVGAGMWDAAWVHRDIGNPRDDWEQLAAFARELACRYHVNGKFYWCDPDYLQVGEGEPNETRVRMALMALGGGTAFICDRLPELPEEKLRLIGRCLPGYGRAAVPLDLFDRDGYPRIWWLDVKTGWGQWAVVGVFNLDSEPIEVDVPLSRARWRGELYAFEFFTRTLLRPTPLWLSPDATLRSSEAPSLRSTSSSGPPWRPSRRSHHSDRSLRVSVPARDVRVLRIAAMPDYPWIVGDDMHLTQGGVELERVRWDARRMTLSLIAHRAAGERGNLFVHVPPTARLSAAVAVGGADLATYATLRSSEATSLRSTSRTGILKVPLEFTIPRLPVRIEWLGRDSDRHGGRKPSR